MFGLKRARNSRHWTKHDRFTPDGTIKVVWDAADSIVHNHGMWNRSRLEYGPFVNCFAGEMDSLLQMTSLVTDCQNLLAALRPSWKSLSQHQLVAIAKLRDRVDQAVADKWTVHDEDDENYQTMARLREFTREQLGRVFLLAEDGLSVTEAARMVEMLDSPPG